MAMLGGLLAFLLFPLHAEDWPHFRGPRHDNSWHAPPLPATWPQAGLPQVWQTEIGGGYSGMAVVDGKLFTQDRQTEPQECERVLCVDAASGKLLWEHRYPVAYGKLDYGFGPRATPTVHQGQVYTLGAVGHVHCLDAETGRVVWSQDLVRDFAAKLPEWGLAASPLIWRDRVIVHPGAPGGCLLAFDRASGKELWRAGNDPAGYATPTLVERPSPQLVAWTPENVLGLSPVDGTISWSIPYKVTYGVSIASPVVYQDIAFVTGYWEGAKAIRLDPATGGGMLLWEQTKRLQGLMCQPLYREGLVFSLDKDEGLLCFELSTGEILWDDDHALTPKDRNPHAAMCWIGDQDRIIALNAEGDLILARLNRHGYQEQSRTSIIRRDPRPIWAHPAFAGKHVYARNDKQIVCVALSSE